MHVHMVIATDYIWPPHNKAAVYLCAAFRLEDIAFQICYIMTSNICVSNVKHQILTYCFVISDVYTKFYKCLYLSF